MGVCKVIIELLLGVTRNFLGADSVHFGDGKLLICLLAGTKLVSVLSLQIEADHRSDLLNQCGCC